MVAENKDINFFNLGHSVLHLYNIGHDLIKNKPSQEPVVEAAQDEFIKSSDLLIAKEGSGTNYVREGIKAVLEKNSDIKIQKINQDGTIDLIYKEKEAKGFFDDYGIRFQNKETDEYFSNYATPEGILQVLDYKQQLDFILVKSFPKKEIVSSAHKNLKDRFKENLGFVPTEWLYNPENKRYIVQVHDKENGIIGRVYFDEEGNKLKEEDYDYKLKETKLIVDTPVKSQNKPKKEEDIYDKAGNRVYKIIYGQDQKPLKILMYDSEGLIFDPINDPIEVVKKKINTKELYDAFEEKYLLNIPGEQFYSTNNWERLLELRNHGKKIYGLPKITENIENRNKLILQTEPAKDTTDQTVEYKFNFMSLKNLEKELPKLDRRLQTYPPGFLGDLGLKSISFVSHLEGKTKTREGWLTGYFNNSTQDAIWLSSSGSTVHHEIYHFLDYKLDGEGVRNNKEWEELHPGRYTKKDDYKDPNTDKRMVDHASSYGLYSVNEDQAETAANLLMPENASILVRKAKNSKILQQKIEFMKLEYCRWINEYCMNKGLMQDVFKRIEEGEHITDDFWNTNGIIKGRTKDSPLEIALNPETPITINYYQDNVWVKIGKPYAVFYVESLPNGDFNWNNKFDFDGKPTNSPLFVNNDGLFMWGLNYPIKKKYRPRFSKEEHEVIERSKNGAVLICEADNYGKVIGKIIFK